MVQRLTAPNYYGALCLLVDEAGFLVESKTAALLAELPANEAKLVAAESIVRALGVTDGPSFDALMDALSDSGGGAGGSNSNAGGGCGRVHVTLAPLLLVVVGWLSDGAVVRSLTLQAVDTCMLSLFPHGCCSCCMTTTCI